MEHGREQILAELETEISFLKMRLNNIEEIVAELKSLEVNSSQSQEASVTDSALSGHANTAIESLAVSPIDECDGVSDLNNSAAVELAELPVDEIGQIELAGKPFDESVSDESVSDDSAVGEAQSFDGDTLPASCNVSVSSAESVVDSSEEPSPVRSFEIETLEEVWNMQDDSEETDEDDDHGTGGRDVISSIGPKFWLTDLAGIPVKDLRSAISMNDRILFINTLFNEDSNLYQDVVRKINGMEHFADAVNFLIPEFKNWNLDSDVVYRFMMAVRRRLK